MTTNQYAVAKAKMLAGESNLRGSSAFKKVVSETSSKFRPNLASLVRSWIKHNDVKPLFPGDPCNIVYFKIGNVRLALLSDNGGFRVALEAEYNKTEMVTVKHWLRNTAGDSDLDRPRTGPER